MKAKDFLTENSDWFDKSPGGEKLYFESEVIRMMNEYANEALRLHDVSGSLPSLDDATKVAVRISEEAITPPLDAKEQAMFIAGFQECIKWLTVFFGNDR